MITNAVTSWQAWTETGYIQEYSLWGAITRFVACFETK